MHGHLVLLAAFFVESQPPARTIVIVIVDFEFQYCADPGEAVEHRGNVKRSNNSAKNKVFATTAKLVRTWQPANPSKMPGDARLSAGFASLSGPRGVCSGRTQRHSGGWRRTHASLRASASACASLFPCRALGRRASGYPKDMTPNSAGKELRQKIVTLHEIRRLAISDFSRGLLSF